MVANVLVKSMDKVTITVWTRFDGQGYLTQSTCELFFFSGLLSVIEEIIRKDIQNLL